MSNKLSEMFTSGIDVDTVNTKNAKAKQDQETPFIDVSKDTEERKRKNSGGENRRIS